MGEVFEAEHRMLKRPCAIKIIHPNDSLDENAAASFAREVRATASLTHPHTVEIYDYGQTRDGLFFCAMEMLPGLNLRDMVQRFGPLPACRVVHFLSEVCGALCEAHGAGLIHRDIKPANIFASQRGGIDDFTKLLDFGLVREIQISESTGPHSGMIAGTPEFMSPEQITSPDRMDARSDLYSLGAVGYFLLTGRPPFMANSPLETMLARVRDTPSLPSDYQQGIPGDLEQVIMRCLQTDASLRPTTAEQLLAELQKCDCAGEWTAKDAAGWWKRVVNLTAVKPNFGNKDSGSKFSTASTCE